MVNKTTIIKTTFLPIVHVSCLKKSLKTKGKKKNKNSSVKKTIALIPVTYSNKLSPNNKRLKGVRKYKKIKIKRPKLKLIKNLKDFDKLKK